MFTFHSDSLKEIHAKKKRQAEIEALPESTKEMAEGICETYEQAADNTATLDEVQAAICELYEMMEEKENG